MESSLLDSLKSYCLHNCTYLDVTNMFETHLTHGPQSPLMCSMAGDSPNKTQTQRNTCARQGSTPPHLQAERARVGLRLPSLKLANLFMADLPNVLH